MQILQTGIFGIIVLMLPDKALKMVLAGVPGGAEHHFGLITIVAGGEKEIIDCLLIYLTLACGRLFTADEGGALEEETKTLTGQPEGLNICF